MSSTVASTADLFQKIQHIRVGMLTTHGEGNTLLSRPMTREPVIPAIPKNVVLAIELESALVLPAAVATS